MDAASAALPRPGERPLELLDRSLGYARSVLAAVPGHAADLPTPCPAWDLADLLGHMVDGFTAFVQASAGEGSIMAVVRAALATAAYRRARMESTFGLRSDIYSQSLAARQGHREKRKLTE